MKSCLRNFKLISSKEKESGSSEVIGQVFVIGTQDKVFFSKVLADNSMDWQENGLRTSEKDLIYFVGKRGPVWIMRSPQRGKESLFGGNESESLYSWSRDNVGSLWNHFRLHQVESVFFHFQKCNREIELGSLIGLGLAAYSFREIAESKAVKGPRILIIRQKGHLNENLIKEASLKVEAINIARHLVNLPPNQLTPADFVKFAKSLEWGPGVTFEIWDEKKLAKERMNLHLAVGQGSANPPRLLIIKSNMARKSTSQGIGFIGKGITFDTGGLDLKPSSAMRLMKKDMGGAASLLGVAYWVSHNRLSINCEFYIPLAENSVGHNSFRPSDIVTARSGARVEIDNTDAEGRLVLADSLSLACENEKLGTLIDVATLTGAIKVALGTDIAGLFSNDSRLQKQLHLAGLESGDLNWPMPMYEKYFSAYSSSFADFKNSAEGFGGAITAALFLQKFVTNRGKKWAHLDIYSWNDKSQGALTSVGGSGQGVQCLIGFLSSLRFKK